MTYLRQELRRRLGRTILTVLGLATGVALVVAVLALSAGVRRAQSQVLGPLTGVGTDMTVTRGFGGQSSAFGSSLGSLGGGLRTDLSKLGKPGQHFSTDSLSPPLLPFTSAQAAKIAKIDGVRATSKVLTVHGIHQEGVVPKLTAKTNAPTATAKKPTGGQTKPPKITAEQSKQFDECMRRQQSAQKSPDPKADAFTQMFEQGGGQCLAALQPKMSTTGSVSGATTSGSGGLLSFTMPGTDIRSRPFSVTGIELKAQIGIISRDQVIRGRLLSRAGEALISDAYAAARKLKVGSTLTLRGRSFKVVGVSKSPLVGETSDIYLTLPDLQALAGLKGGQASTVLVRAASAAKVEGVTASIARAVPGVSVSAPVALADTVKGSLVDSANLIRRLGLVLGAVAMVAAILIVMLLTLISVSKRTRELGTLKAIGWTPALVVRQIVAESAAQGVLGAIVGVALGFGAAALVGVFGPSLSAQTQSRGGLGDLLSGGPASLFGLGSSGERASAVVHLTAPVRPGMVALAVVLAVAGGLAAGAVGAMRAARLRPADAMREVS